MKESKERGERNPSCGYGLLGLCCSACLVGPCRLSPFDDVSATGLCGEDRDLIVAKNMLRLVVFEAMEEMKRLRETIQRCAGQILPKRRIDETTRVVAEKYLLSSNLSRRGLLHHLLRESRKLLSPFAEAMGPSIKGLFPEEIFPHLHQNDLFSGSGMSLLLDSESFPKLDEILYRSLRISFCLMISRELRADMEGLTGGGSYAAAPSYIFPPSYPILLLLKGEDSFFGESTDEMEKRLGEAGPVLTAKELRSLIPIGKGLFQRWSLPASETIGMALVISKSVTDVLAPLLLGLNAASIPPLPIHGSERVERFFSEELKNRFGSLYVIPGQEGLASAVLSFLGKNR